MIVTIKKIGINGEGIGYYKRKPVFIDDCLPNEIVEFEIKDEFEKYIIGKKTKLIKKSNNRTKAKCHYYDYCGGCQLMHTDYQNQLEIKKDLLVQTLCKYAKLDAKMIDKIVGSKHIYGYRNELKLPVKMFQDRLYSGMYLKGSNAFKRIDNCLVHEAELEKIKNLVLEQLNYQHLKAYNNKTKEGLRYIVLRGFNSNYQLSLIFGKKKKYENIVNSLRKIKALKSVYFSFNTSKDPLINREKPIKVYGVDKLDLNIDGYKFEVSMDAFVQLNLSQAINIFHYIKNIMKPSDVLVEEYCGIGIMSILFSDLFKKIYASELNKASIEDFKNNVKLNNIDNIEIKASDAYKHLNEINKSIDYLLVDPPRSGLDHKMIKTILNKDIKNIIYMSCSLSSLGKNIDALKQKYKVESIEAFDMFPNTSHVETICLITRK